MFGASSSVGFKHEEFSDVHLNWGVLNGAPVEYTTDARFKSLVCDKDPVNIPRLADILLGIMPPAGEILEAHAIKLPDQASAVEMVQTRKVRPAERIVLYVLLFALEPPATDRGPDFDYDSLRQYCDPVTNQLIMLSPVSLGERLNPSAKDIHRVFQVGHDRYQRIVFSAPEQKFHSMLPAIRRTAHSFHYKVRTRSPRHNWQDAAQLIHEEMNASFEVLNNPPAGLRDEDIGRTKTE